MFLVVFALYSTFLRAFYLWLVKKTQRNKKNTFSSVYLLQCVLNWKKKFTLMKIQVSKFFFQITASKYGGHIFNRRALCRDLNFS